MALRFYFINKQARPWGKPGKTWGLGNPPHKAFTGQPHRKKNIQQKKKKREAYAMDLYQQQSQLMTTL
jgi:hypothetical protein